MLDSDYSDWRANTLLPDSERNSSPWHSRSTVEVCCWTMESLSAYFIFTLGHLDGEAPDELEKKKEKKGKKKKTEGEKRIK